MEFKAQRIVKGTASEEERFTSKFALMSHLMGLYASGLVYETTDPNVWHFRGASTEDYVRVENIFEK